MGWLTAIGTAAGGALGGPVGAMIGGGIGSTLDSNSAQASANNWNADQAQISRDWQERMSNTAYQREVADMKAAGLNPMLAYKAGGASTPSGATASGAVSSLPAANQNELVGAQVQLMRAQSASALADANKKVAETPTNGNLGDATIANLTAQNNKIAEEIVLISRNASNATQQGHVLTATVSQLEESVRLMKAQGKTQVEQAEQLRAMVAKIQNEVGLSNLELAAKNFSGNFGYISNEFKLVADVLTDMVPNVGRILQGAKKRGGWSTTERSDGKGNRSMETRQWGEE